MTEVAKGADGKLELAMTGTAAENWRDIYHDQCPMKW